MRRSVRRAAISAVLAGALAGCAPGGPAGSPVASAAGPVSSPAVPDASTNPPVASPVASPASGVPAASGAPAGGIDPCRLVTPAELATAFGGTFLPGVSKTSPVGAECLFPVTGGAADEGITILVDGRDPALTVAAFSALRQQDISLGMGVAVSGVGDSAWITKGTVTIHVLQGTTWVDVTKGYGGIEDFSNPEPAYRALTAVARLIVGRVAM